MEKWGHMTGDERTRIGGERDRLAGLIQERFGSSRECAKEETGQFALAPKPTARESTR